MTIQQMLERKRELGYSNQQISKLSGVPLGTVIKIFGGTTTSPRRETIVALEKILGPDPRYDYDWELPPSAIRERAPGYDAAPRLYTIDDYYALPDDRRVELIDGVIYDLASPTKRHQRILLNLSVQFKQCEDSHPGKCKVYIAPLDVQLDRDEYTMVQPDVLVVCDDGKFDDVRIVFGAPDLCVEILSPSSRSKDSLLKLQKYKKAGVREYWIVDPGENMVMVYVFEENSYKTYSFEDTIPIFISGGRCAIDFREVDK